jgi:hypothetical protein
MELIISRKIRASKGRGEEDQRVKHHQKEGKGDQSEKQREGGWGGGSKMVGGGRGMGRDAKEPLE